MATARELSNKGALRLEYDAGKVELLLDYIAILDEAGLDARQMYSRHARACNEVEKELGIDTE